MDERIFTRPCSHSASPRLAPRLRGGFGVSLAVFSLLFAVMSHETPTLAYILCCAGLCLYGTSSGLVHGPLEVRFTKTNTLD